MQNYFSVLAKYAVIKGRASRYEYWMFILVSCIVAFIFGMIDAAVFNKGQNDFGISDFYNLSVLIPTICVGIRRMHDTNRSGWYLIIPFYGLILCCIKGDKTTNRFNEAPWVA